MKKLLLLLITSITFGQQVYYNDVNLNLNGIALRNELASKIISTHDNNLSYSDAREAIRITDLEPGQNNNVLLVYGFSSGLCPSSSGSDNDHRRRNKFDFGGGATCEWNREHTYPQSLGTPNIGTSGPGADAHMLRASDVQRNGQRGSKRFATGSGNSGTVNGGSNWYPGDEWKGDVARIMMYMYLRYGNQCLPTNVCVGSVTNIDNNMVELLLQWNVEDPVSIYEENRNNYLAVASNEFGQGNRNPFIDNPYLATKIWGGQNAEDIWGIFLATENAILDKNISVFPNPVKDVLTITSSNEVLINSIVVYSITGKIISKNNVFDNNFNLNNLLKGFYFIKIKTNKGTLTKKIVVN